MLLNCITPQHNKDCALQHYSHDLPTGLKTTRYIERLSRNSGLERNFKATTRTRSGYKRAHDLLADTLATHILRNDNILDDACAPASYPIQNK